MHYQRDEDVAAMKDEIKSYKTMKLNIPYADARWGY